ncbi:MAG: FecR domain-containing protein, partial [Chthoniobacterales bacterium]
PTRLLAISVACCGLACPPMDAAPAHLTRVIDQVKIQTGSAASRPAKVGEALPEGATLRTGATGRAELAFETGTVVRLGARTDVALSGEAPTLQLQDGVVLFQSARRARAPKLATAGINLATAGSTGMIERSGAAYVKILVLEGTTRVYLKRIGESVLVTAGQLLITAPDAKTLPEAVDFDVEQLYRTSVLTRRDFGPLASASAIQEAIRKQKNDPSLVHTNLVIFGRGTLVNLVEPTPAPAASSSPAPSRIPKPRKP